MLLGPNPLPSFFDWTYELIFVYVGLTIGSILALLFILTDVFYLNKKLQNNAHPTIIRFLTLIFIFILVAITHYVLEKVIDVI